MEDFSDEFEVTESGVPYTSKPNIVLEKSFAFSVRIVNLYKWLYKNHKDILPLADRFCVVERQLAPMRKKQIARIQKKNLPLNFKFH
jgi:hypothetical protein